MHIRYRLDISPLHGVGLFTTQLLKKGQLVYTASPLLDLNISQAAFDSLCPSEQQEIRWWGFWNKSEQVWHVDFDVSKFMNHSYQATVTQDPNHVDAYLIAARDVEAGEEMTQNYLEFESEEDLKARGIMARIHAGA